MFAITPMQLARIQFVFPVSIATKVDLQRMWEAICLSRKSALC
jgi:hypothetical protein